MKFSKFTLVMKILGIHYICETHRNKIHFTLFGNILWRTYESDFRATLIFGLISSIFIFGSISTINLPSGWILTFRLFFLVLFQWTLGRFQKRVRDRSRLGQESVPNFGQFHFTVRISSRLRLESIQNRFWHPNLQLTSTIKWNRP